jgi:methylphosphotriester-DNA--protein-cysteine methyltransferase
MHVILSPRDVLVPAPPRQAISRRSQRQSNAVKYQAIALIFCTPTAPEAEKLRLISEITHISLVTLYRLKKKAVARGFDPTKDLRVEEWYVDNAKPPRPYRTATSAAMEKKVIKYIEKNRAGREKSAEIIAYQCGISMSSVLRILKRRGYKKRKPT